VYCFPVSQFAHHWLFQVGHHWLPQAGAGVQQVHCNDGTCVLQTSQPKQSELDEQVAHALLEHVHCVENGGILHVDHAQHSEFVVHHHHHD
jgi:hypothetical protein